ncbi:MAG: cyclic nucleotide-binding domain-containing protein [Labilithrix sp.]|nr:cyclic nucleotide-binding domain-containing protein [Labilithrix sp.]MCW5813433.1 cyclic nucleotide-binding domain-containing protein [Labilithrix sp.]
MRKVLFIFGQLSDADVDWLAKHGRKERVAKGAALITEGVPVERLYIVLEGELVVQQGKTKREIARLGVGEVAGEMSFVDARPPSATVSAAGDAVVYAISRRVLAGALEQNPGFGLRFYKSVATFLSDRLRNATDASYDDELDDSVLDNVDRAGARFNALARQVQEARGS